MGLRLPGRGRKSGRWVSILVGSQNHGVLEPARVSAGCGTDCLDVDRRFAFHVVLRRAVL